MVESDSNSVASMEQDAITVAQKADAAIIVLGESEEIVGEGKDRSDLSISDYDLNVIKAVKKTGTPTVVVLLNGRPLTINWVDENIPAILEGWFPGEFGGDAIADVLFGDYNPSGRPPVSSYKSVEDIPPFDDYNMKGRTYRYFNGNPLYAFGYGLSYTSFEYTKLEIQGKTITGEEIPVVVSVQNNGNKPGDEVVQLYITDLNASFPVPIRALAAFRRIHIQPGEKQIVEFTINPRQLSLIDDNSNRILEPGEFLISAGGGQPDSSLGTRSFVSKIIEVSGKEILFDH